MNVDVRKDSLISSLIVMSLIRRRHPASDSFRISNLIPIKVARFRQGSHRKGTATTGRVRIRTPTKLLLGWGICENERMYGRHRAERGRFPKGEGLFAPARKEGKCGCSRSTQWVGASTSSLLSVITPLTLSGANFKVIHPSVLARTTKSK